MRPPLPAFHRTRPKPPPKLPPFPPPPPTTGKEIPQVPDSEQFDLDMSVESADIGYNDPISIDDLDSEEDNQNHLTQQEINMFNKNTPVIDIDDDNESFWDDFPLQILKQISMRFFFDFGAMPDSPNH